VKIKVRRVDRMEDTNEIKQLLGEIRDLLKVNLEANAEFRKGALARGQASDERVKVAREEERRFREEVAQEIKETQTVTRKSLGGPWGFVVRMAVAICLAVCAAIILLREFNLISR
jgi:hypothetical protein